LAVSVVPLIPKVSVVETSGEFRLDGKAILIKPCDIDQLKPPPGDSNISYDLRVGGVYRDHRRGASGRNLQDGKVIKLRPGTAVVIQTEEWVEFPTTLMGHILPKVTLLEQGVANTPTKIDPGYKGYLVITAFNHGRNVVRLRPLQKFAALYVLSVGEGVIAYDKPGKYLVGQPYRNWWRDAGDWIRDTTPYVAYAGVIIASLSAIFEIWRHL
jgi:dCTP deaminase